MKNLGPDARALIAAGRKRAQPNAADRDRVGDKLATKLPAFAALASTAQITSAAAQVAAPSVTAAAGAAGGIAGKVALLSAIAAATAITATSILLVGRDDRPVVRRPQTAAAARAPAAVDLRVAATGPARTSLPAAAPAAAAHPIERTVATRAAPEVPASVAPSGTAPEREPPVSAPRTAEVAPRAIAQRENRRAAQPSQRPAPIAEPEPGIAPSPPASAPIATAPGTIEKPLEAVGADVASAPLEQPTALPVKEEIQPLASELHLLDAARSALNGGDPARALLMTDRHAATYPSSVLAQERLALRALSLCALDHKDAAQEALAALERRAPGSPLAAGVRRACAEKR